MKQKVFKFSLIVILVLSAVAPVKAQRHFYNRLELGGGNVWTFVGLEGISMVINQLTHRPMSEATLRFCSPASEMGNLNSFQGFDDWNYDRFQSEDYEYSNNTDYASFKTDALLSNLIIGEKIGYLTDYMGATNYCFYGAAYYNLQKFKCMSNAEDYVALTTHRAQIGGGAMVILGSIEKKNRFIIDGGIRYNIPIGFGCADYDGATSDALNSGISSHYMFKWSYDNSVAVGATLDLMHYNIFKDPTFCGSSSKTTEFGITVSILLKQ